MTPHLTPPSPPPDDTAPRPSPLRSYAWVILRNILGWLLIITAWPSGILLPGPNGTLMFLIGFALISFPGKRKFTSRVLSGKPLTFRRRKRWWLWPLNTFLKCLAKARRIARPWMRQRGFRLLPPRRVSRQLTDMAEEIIHIHPRYPERIKALWRKLRPWTTRAFALALITLIVYWFARRF